MNAATTLLDAPQSHAVLRAVLPSLGNLIHDTNKTVRLAAVKMLLKIKAMKGIKYYHVVPVDHLKARLAEEGRISMKVSTLSDDLFPLQSDVATGLTRLMINSFVPQGPQASALDQIQRTLNFLKEDPEAAIVFYANIADHLDINSVAKLVAMLLQCLSSAVETEKSKNQSQIESEEESDDEPFLIASNTRLMASISEALASMWESIRDDLECEENEAGLRCILKSFSGTVLTDILSYFENKALDHENSNEILTKSLQNDCYRVCAALLRCAGFLDPKHVKGLVNHISSSLHSHSMFASAEASALSTRAMSNHLALLCLWGMTEDVSVCLSSSLTSAFDDGHGESLDLLSPVSDKSKKRKNGRGSSAKKNSIVANDSMLPSLPGDVAIAVLGDIFRGSEPSSIAARECLIENTKACKALDDAFERGTAYAGRLMRMASVVSTSGLPWYPGRPQ